MKFRRCDIVLWSRCSRCILPAYLGCSKHISLVHVHVLRLPCSKQYLSIITSYHGILTHVTYYSGTLSHVTWYHGSLIHATYYHGTPTQVTYCHVTLTQVSDYRCDTDFQVENPPPIKAIYAAAHSVLWVESRRLNSISLQIPSLSHHVSSMVYPNAQSGVGVPGRGGFPNAVPRIVFLHYSPITPCSPQPSLVLRAHLSHHWYSVLTSAIIGTLCSPQPSLVLRANFQLENGRKDIRMLLLYWTGRTHLGYHPRQGTPCYALLLSLYFYLVNTLC
jgi:hypothetical protein